MTLRTRFAAVLAAACAAVATSSFAQPPAPASLDALLGQALEDRNIPAMAVLTIRDGAIAGQAVRGVRAAGRPEPARLDDAWHIGSDGKAMTATMIARLVERGTLSWSTPLPALLPGTPMRPEYRDVTLVDLLSHRAGLRDLDDTRDAALLAAAFADRRPLPEQRQALARTVLAEPPIGPAHAESSYSNSGYVLAAAIAERATGRSFEALMQAEVFEPLGMKVAYADSRPGEVLGHKAGKPLTGPQADNPRLFAPAGEVRLTMHDWAVFAIDQMAGERGQGKLLKAPTYLFLHAPQGDTSAALGWGVRTTWPKEAPIRMISHAGSNGYWNALIALAPDRQGGVLVAANAGDGTDAEKAETAVILTLMREVAAQP